MSAGSVVSNKSVVSDKSALPKSLVLVGAGKMGGAMARRLGRAGHSCVGFARSFADSPDTREAFVKGVAGATAADSIADVVRRLEARPRVVWLMLPAGEVTESAVTELATLLDAGDIVIDGGNSFYKDDIRRAKTLAERGIDYVDCGTSGGVWGDQRGYCMMIGGPKPAVEHLDPIFSALAPGIGDTPRTPGREKGVARSEQGYISMLVRPARDIS